MSANAVIHNGQEVQSKAALKRLVAQGLDVEMLSHWTVGGPTPSGLLSELPDGEYAVVFPSVEVRRSFGNLIIRGGKVVIQ